jgi:hypothetical protein
MHMPDYYLARPALQFDAATSLGNVYSNPSLA